jgi:hypothetical protein
LIELETEAEVPNVDEALNASLEDVLAAFQRLHQKRLLVPEPGNPSRIRMAPPFSGVETPFRVKIIDKHYFANCAWDALGIPAALHVDAIIEAYDLAANLADSIIDHLFHQILLPNAKKGVS